jgi:hypothetical protein
MSTPSFAAFELAMLTVLTNLSHLVVEDCEKLQGELEVIDLVRKVSVIVRVQL